MVDKMRDGGCRVRELEVTGGIMLGEWVHI